MAKYEVTIDKMMTTRIFVESDSEENAKKIAENNLKNVRDRDFYNNGYTIDDCIEVHEESAIEEYIYT
tara:strand:- start:161 stop:364 length:204 start_codon:yes stop_codon:yes gene_type:complete